MRFRTTERKCRDIPTSSSVSTLIISMILRNLHFIPVLGYLLITVPAMVCGCAGDKLHEAHTHQNNVILLSSYKSKAAEGSTLDIFAFENDRMKRLDSYQRVEDFTSNRVVISSTAGEKTFFLCADGQRNRYEWGDISSYYSLEDICCELEHETHERRVLTGEFTTTAGDMRATALLKPLTCEITVKAICCDFSGTPYAGSVIQNARAYITNVNASCPLLYTENSHAARIINMGMLNQAELKQFKSKDIIMQDIAPEIGRTTIYPDACFLCYPNTPEDESPGSPFTRLVIEGKIDSHTCYWPITVNAPEGVIRGCRYVYDIFIRRKGVTDPDIPIDPTSMEIKMNIRKWNDIDEYSVGF